MLDRTPGSARRGRDAALKRLRWCNRALAGVAVLLTIVLANAAARSFSGHPRRVADTGAAPTPIARTTASRARAPHHRHAKRRSRRALTSTSTSTSTPTAPAPTTASAPAPTTTEAPSPAPPAAAPQPAPTSAPAPVVSGGS